MDAERMKADATSGDVALRSPAQQLGKEENAVRMALARAVASRKVPNEAISAVAKRLAAGSYRIRGVDICALGTCVDYFFTKDDDWRGAIGELLAARNTRIHGLTVFPWGIIDPDLIRVRVEQEFDEFAEFNVNVQGMGGH